MASGKQLSFQCGEVSPSLRFRSDAVSYASGLSKLRNKFVRKAGGVSNRPGLEFVAQAKSQLGIPLPGGLPGVRGFTYWSADQDKWVTVEYAQFSTDLGTPTYGFSFDGGTPQNSANASLIKSPTPDKVRFTPLKNTIFVTPETTNAYGAHANIALYTQSNSIRGTFGNNVATFICNLAASTYGWKKPASYSGPYYPAVYMVTVTYTDGTEGFLYEVFNSGSNTDGTGTLYYPNGSVYTEFSTVLYPGFDANVKSINYYKGIGPYTTSINYKLAGRTLYTPGTGTTFFKDFGIDDPATTPPIDGFGIMTYKTGLTYLRGVECASYYQQRLFMGMKPNTSTSIKSGDVLASKLGAPEQISAPVIYNTTGAFQFSVPITDGTPVIASLAMERLILFTAGSVYVVRGGEQGSVTPTDVNPLNVSEEGCSYTVEPKMVGRKGYYVNNSHTKLMAIEFGVDGNLTVYESSKFSDHLLLEDAIQLEVLSHRENTVFLLRRDGKLIQVTNGEDENAQGYSLIDTPGGYIESIYRGKAKKKYIPNSIGQETGGIYYDVLMAYVIRNGKRNLERLNVREDRYPEGYIYSDCSSFFGWRLSENGQFGYLRTATAEMSNYYTFDTDIWINIQPSASWDAGTVIKIRTTKDIVANQLFFNFVIDFYYDEGGEKKTLRYMINYGSRTAIVAGSWNFEYTGTFLSDVPVCLQNVEGKSISEPERIRRYTRWCPAINFLDAYTAPGPYAAEDFTGIPVANISGKRLSLFADGEVVASPLNPHNDVNVRIAYDVGHAVTRIQLPDYYAYGVIGTPYQSEFETMDLEASDNRTLTDSRKLLNAVGVGFYETRGGFYGIQNQTLENMEENYFNEDNADFSLQTKNFNGHQTIHIPAEWNGPGRINIKQVDPAPMTILAVYPKGISGD